MKIFNKYNRSMRDLVRYYSKILVVIISIFGVFASLFVMQLIRRDVNYSLSETQRLIDATMFSYNSEARRMTYNIFSNTKDTDDLRYYFTHTMQEYALKNVFDSYVFFPLKVSNLYINYNELQAISISSSLSEDYYFSTKENRVGRKVSEVPEVENSIVVNQVLIDQVTYEVLGYVTFYFDSEMIDRQITSNRKHLKPSVVITNETDAIIYRHNYDGNIDDKFNFDLFMEEEDLYNPENYTNSKYSPLNYKMHVYLPKSLVNGEIFLTLSIIILFTVTVDAILIYTLLITFGSYTKQVEDIIETVDEIKDGDYSHRIKLNNKGSELYNISVAINEMLNNITEYIDTIYQLEVKQRDINLLALQSQINPHFLYNTLEYIRMYAVSEGVDELAEVVYAFSELLRNNISLARETTLASELEFVENYIYLYQMRYPNRLAYKVSIQESLKEIMMPKFTIQPLIENYIKHGVDFNRIDNAIHIIAYEEDGYVMIEISDNGRGADLEILKTIKEKIDRDTIDIQSGSSIGLYNVHERLKAYFKDAYTIDIESKLNEGFIVRIKIDSKHRDLTSKLYAKEKNHV